MITKQEYKNVSLNCLLSNNLKISFQKTNYIKFVHKLTNKYTNNGDKTYDPFLGEEQHYWNRDFWNEKSMQVI